ncbi:MAG: SRPBCC domain-containing protein [Bacteroidota bacterium]
MNKSPKTLEFKFERTIPAPLAEVFDAWLNPETPGTPWHENDKLIFNPDVDGLWYWLIRGTAHYGRFTEIERPSRIQHTWMSKYTLGHESVVTVSFEKKGEETLMTLLHSGLPDDDAAKSHKDGWTYFLDKLVDHFGTKARRRP